MSIAEYNTLFNQVKFYCFCLKYDYTNTMRLHHTNVHARSYKIYK